MSLRPTRGLPSSSISRPGQVDRLDLAGEGAADSLLGVLALDRREEADGAEVDAEDGHAGAGEAAQRVQDRAVAAHAPGRGRPPRRPAAPPRSARRGRRAWPALRAWRRSASRASPAAATAASTASVVAGGCEWVISDRRLHSARSLPERRGEVVDPVALARAPDEGLDVALRPRQPRGREAAHREPEAAGRLGDAEDRLAAVARVADDALADPLAAELELRLDHRQQLAGRRQAGGHRGQDLRQRDEGDVDRREAGGEGKVGGQHLAGVEPLDHGHARVVAHRLGDLAVGDVDRRDPGGAALQHAVAEAAGRGADVEAVAAGEVDRQRLERVLELDPAPRDEARAGVDEQVGLGLDQLARPQRERAVASDPDLARPHGAGGRRARREQAPLGENGVYAGLLHRRNGTAPPRPGPRTPGEADLYAISSRAFTQILKIG